MTYIVNTRGECFTPKAEPLDPELEELLYGGGLVRAQRRAAEKRMKTLFDEIDLVYA